jgi:hypothetical protein
MVRGRLSYCPLLASRGLVTTLLSRIRPFRGTYYLLNSSIPSLLSVLSTHLTDSMTRREVDCIQQETQLFEEEAEQLRVRTQQVMFVASALAYTSWSNNSWAII